MNVTHKLKGVVPEPPKPRYRDYIAICLDSSSSMATNADRAYKALVEQFENIGKLQADPNRDVYLNYYTFSDRVTPHVVNTKNKVNVPERRHYLPHGMTALRDAFYRATKDLEVYDFRDQPNTSFLIVVITDGGENVSKVHTAALESLMLDKSSRENWTYVLIGPKGCESWGNQFGIPQGNMLVWDATKAVEYDRVSHVTVRSVTDYAAATVSGTRKTTKFFSDLSSYTPQQARKDLADVTVQYRSVLATKQIRLDDFFRFHESPRVFEKGVSFYCLTKPEKVQASKSILLRDKATKVVYAGDTRAVLGLPNDGHSEVRVTPGNHANWEIFIQSKSDNRLLVRGTPVLIKKAYGATA